jgi:hypothetical protein
LVLTLALILTFSPEEKGQRLDGCGFAGAHGANPVACFSKWLFLHGDLGCFEELVFLRFDVLHGGGFNAFSVEFIFALHPA